MESTSTSPLSPSAVPSTGSADAEREFAEQQEQEEPGSRTKLYAVLGGTAMLLLFVILTAALYMLGDDDQSALERLRDIAVIYIVLSSIIMIVLMAAGTAALIYLVLQIRNQVIPLLQEATATVNRVRGTTEFMTEEAVKPIITAAGKVAQWKAMIRVISGR